MSFPATWSKAGLTLTGIERMEPVFGMCFPARGRWMFITSSPGHTEVPFLTISLLDAVTLSLAPLMPWQGQTT